MRLTVKYLRLYGKSLLKLVRWVNLLLVFFTQYVVYVLIVRSGSELQSLWPPLEFFLLSISTVLIAAAGYVINDYYDIKIDLVNKPGRVVIGRIITRRQSLFIHAILNGVAILLGLLLSWRVALFFAVCGFLLWLYSNYLKRTALWGNVCVSILTAATIWVVTLYYKENSRLVLLYSAFAFFISLIREVLKDMEDVKGDVVYGCRTLPIVWGFRKTKLFLLGIMALFIGLLWYQSTLSERALPYYLLTIPIIYLIVRLVKADKQRDYTFLSSYCKWFMVVGVASLVAV